MQAPANWPAYERRRSPAPRGSPSIPSAQPPAGGSSSSSYSRYQPSMSAPAMRTPPQPHPLSPARADTPPASAYFTNIPSGSHAHEARPTPDAGAHFAYSTTLRRHAADDHALASTQQVLRDEGAAGLWHKAVDVITGAQQQAQNGYAQAPREETGETASGKFAHYTIEVRLA